MVERMHCQLKAAIKCHTSENWMEVLLLVLLGMRAAWREDQRTSAAELLYGEKLRLPGEFLAPQREEFDTSEFVKRLRKHFKELTPIPINRHGLRKTFIFRDLATADIISMKREKEKVVTHNLCFAYGPSVGEGHLAGAAENVAGTSLVLAPAAFLALGLVRKKLSQLRGLAACILGLVTGATLPSSRPKSHASKRDLGAGQSFVPPVLRRRYNPAIIEEETVSITLNSLESPKRS